MRKPQFNMKMFLIPLLAMLFNARSLLAQSAPRARYSPKESAFDVVTEKNESGDVHVIHLKGLGATLPPLRQSRPTTAGPLKDAPLFGQIVDVRLEGNWLAVVQDWGGISLVYQLYELQNGSWEMKSQKLFFALKTDRVQALCLVRLESLDKVRVTMLKKSESFFIATGKRIAGEVKPGDPSLLFEFKPDGSILRDSEAYVGGRND